MPVKSKKGNLGGSPLIGAQSRKRTLFARLGLCRPCARGLAEQGFSGRFQVCEDCKDIDLSRVTRPATSTENAPDGDTE